MWMVSFYLIRISWGNRRNVRGYRTSSCAKQAIVLYEYQRTPSVSCKASRAGCTRMGTRATTNFLRISGWLGAGRMQGENLTRR